MYHNIRSIEDVECPINDANGMLYYLQKGNLVLYNKSPEVILYKENVSRLIAFSNTIIIMDDLNNIINVYDLSSRKIQSITDFNIRIRNKEDSSLLFYIKTKPRNYGYADLNGIQFKTSSSAVGLIKKDVNHIFDIDETFIRLFANHESFKWSFNFMSIKNDIAYEFEKFLGVAHNKLFVLTKHYHLIVINIENGALIRVIDKNETFLTREAFLHPTNKNIYNLSTYFVRYNTETLITESVKRVVEEKSEQNPSPVLYGIKDSALQGEYISFTSFTKERVGFAKWIGLYDYSNEEIAWQHELLPAEGQLSIPAFEYPKLTGKKLYVLDSKKTLHVYERELD